MGPLLLYSCTVKKRRPTEGHERSRNFLSETEVEQLLDAARKNHHGGRDHLLLLMMYRHGLRVSEATAIKLADLDLQQARLWIRRLKNGLSIEHPLASDELRTIKRYLKTRDSALSWLFLIYLCRRLPV
jgi:integrase